MAALGKRAHVFVEAEKDEDDLVQFGDDDNDEEGSEGGSDGEESAGEENASVGESGGEEAEDEDDQNGDVEENPNAGWAEAMAKILGKKTPDGKPCILVKDKKVDKLSEKKRKERLEKKKQADKKKAWEMMCRVKPDVVQDKERERSLQKIATRGVVQLFNAVRKHQQNMDEKIKTVGGSERKKAKIISSVSKKDFIDILRGTAGAVVPTVKKEQPAPEEPKDEKPSWSVLRDDFMMGASMKDWDKASDAEQEEDGSGAGEDLNSDSD
ncbi:RRP15-like protein [Astyanax mexicanus]|uniref:RRP15-like protein n=2 Tax=Astyanax mexicanus TaxID=7994 RepID=A0A8B9R8Z4_ASTMX|nr:RRP15-like protein [Astyanax mexicanus]KAG9276394.1 RRP15-like protein [Astyanax mexicanus]